MRMLDEHWIAYPEFVAGSPGVLEGPVFHGVRHSFGHLCEPGQFVLNLGLCDRLGHFAWSWSISFLPM
jgi:hypothetical protein